MQGVEALGENLVESLEAERIVPSEEMVHKGEAVLVVEHIEVTDYIRIFHVSAAEGHRLVENGEGVPHSAVRLVGDDVERLVVDVDSLFPGHHPEVLHNVVHPDAVEIVGLATGEDGRKNLVLLGGRKDENRVCRRLLKGFKEGVEGLG